MSKIDAAQVVNHLEAQLKSLLRLKDILLEQDDAVASEDAQRVLDSVGELRVHLAERVELESQRERLLNSWARDLNCLPEEVSARKIAEQDELHGDRIRSLSEEVHREAIRVQSMHSQVQTRLRSELSFVSCLVDALYPKTDPGSYSPHQTSKTPTPLRTLDVKS